jgi:hypothetical protein
MSAWVVTKEHIDLMVRAAVQRGCRMDTGREHIYLRQLAEGDEAPEGDAYSITDYGNGTRILYWLNSAEHADDLGRLLWWENMRSVAYRYDECDLGTLPGPIDFDAEQTTTYRYPVTLEVYAPRPDPVVVLKSISCYEYQSCEHPDWPTSDAQTICRWLRDKMISSLPGYAEAPWGIDPARVSA